ncbi:MAG TPA: DUF4038 domain-containing protein [Actinoplanes sp.]
MSLRKSITALTAGAVVALGLVVVAPASAETPGSTLQPSANGRYVQWSDGTPIFLLSDTAWLMPGRYSDSEVINHATTRAAQGFTSIQMTAAFPEVQGGTALQNINDIFTGGDMARPIDSYFDRVEWVVNTVTSRGLVVILNPFWKKTMDTYLDGQGETKTRNYGRYLAGRFVNNPRVAYFLGGDATPGVVRPELNAMGLGVLDAYTAAAKPKPLVAFHSKPGETSREAWPTGATWLNLDWTYDYSPPLSGAEGSGGAPYVENWLDWAKTPAMPIMFGEGWYDRNNGTATSSRWGDRHMLRRQAWWSTFSGGIGGYAYGAEPIWLHRYGSITPTTALTWESGKDAARMTSFLTSTQWTRLQPDINHTFLTGGYGTYKYLDHAIASVADDKSFAVVYTPTAHSLNLRMPASGRTYTLRWFDPSNGTYRSGSTTAASGAAITMTTPGNNASGKPDWAIHVTSGVVNPTAPGTPTGVTATVGNASATVSWTAPSNGGSPITRYTVTGTPAGTCTTTGATSCTVTGLTNGTAYTFRVTATNSVGTGAASSPSTAVTPTSGTPVPANTFRIVNRNSGKALTIAADGQTVVQMTDTGAANQHFRLVDLGTGYSKLVNPATGKALDVFGRSLLDGAVVAVWTDNGGLNQQWTVTTLDGGYRKLINRNSGKVLDVADRSVLDNGAVIQWTDNGGLNQQWTFSAV